jgi:hypothetical protein
MLDSTLFLMEEDLSLTQCRERIATAREALAGLDAALWHVTSGGGPDVLSGC